MFTPLNLTGKLKTLLSIAVTCAVIAGCGGGSSSSGNAPTDFVMEVPVETSSYVNIGDLSDMAYFIPQLVTPAHADTIVQLPTLANNTIQSWWTDLCATTYDEADPANIRLLPLVGNRKKLVVGETYHLIVEADRHTLINPCSHGYAVTGEWAFIITTSTVGLAHDNVRIVDQFPTGELVIDIVDNGTDYSSTPVVTIEFDGTDAGGLISGSAEFEIVKNPLQAPHANRLQFDGKEVKYRQKTNVIVDALADAIDIRVIGPHISKSFWISNVGTLSSGQLDGDTWRWSTPSDDKEIIGFLVTMENGDNVISQKKFIVYDESSTQ